MGEGGEGEGGRQTHQFRQTNAESICRSGADNNLGTVLV